MGAITMTILTGYQSAVVIKTCNCGQSYTRQGWLQLARKGGQTVEGIRLEMRDCICGSTLAMWCDEQWQPFDPQPTDEELETMWERGDHEQA